MSSPDERAVPKKSPWGGLRLLACLALFGFFALAMPVLIFYVVPEQNDYGRVSVLKHQRLNQMQSPRIVLIGGSNLAYGIDSALIESRTGCSIVNMGMNGFFGTRFMQSEVQSSLRPSDIAVLAFEYDSFVKSPNGSPSSLAVVVKENPAVFQYLSFRQKAALLVGYVYASQRKVMRLIREQAARFQSWLSLPSGVTGGADIDSIERYSGFNSYGDLVAHLNIHWAGPIEHGMNLAQKPINPQVIALMQRFSRDLHARGVTVLVSHTSVSEDYYRQYQAQIEALDAQLASTSGLVMTARKARDYVFPRSQMFDTDYHLNAEGRRRRSEMLADDILASTNGACRPGAAR